MCTPPLLIIAGALAVLFILGAGIALVMTSGQTAVDERMEQFVSTTVGVNLPESVDAADGPDMADWLDKALSRRNMFEPIKERISRADAKLPRDGVHLSRRYLWCCGRIPGATFCRSRTPGYLGVVGIFLGLRLPRFYAHHGQTAHAGL